MLDFYVDLEMTVQELLRDKLGFDCAFFLIDDYINLKTGLIANVTNVKIKKQSNYEVWDSNLSQLETKCDTMICHPLY